MRYRNKADATYGLVLLLSAGLILAMFVSDCWWNWNAPKIFPYHPWVLPFLIVLALLFLLRRGLL
ncbi:MAG: hypothetical protein ABJC04_06810, partial [Verrucomicrobiota bacterium]